MKKSHNKLNQYQKFILQVAPTLLFIGAMLFIGSGIFIFFDERQPNPTVDGSIAITIGVLVLGVGRPFLKSAIRKAYENDKKTS